MIGIERITPELAMKFREVRLRALKDAPSAFGSTYASESQFPDSEWIRRARRWSGEIGIGYLAMDEDEACGIAGAFLLENEVTKANLVSMWTAPSHRQRGVGRMLVNEVAEWARGRGARTLLLMVTSVNEGAMVFYERLGFQRTGRTEPYPNDPAIMEYEMSRCIL
jgi:ribosomal protein S18 acetylase RimI-like enzyme